MEDEVDAGALVEAELEGGTEYFLLVPAAGGLVVENEGREITLLTPASGLYQKLLGMRMGETLEEPELMVTEVA